MFQRLISNIYTLSNRCRDVVFVYFDSTGSVYLIFTPSVFHALVCFAISLRVFVVSSSFFHYMERLSDRANALTHARSSAQSPFRMSCLFFPVVFHFMCTKSKILIHHTIISGKREQEFLSSSFFLCVCKRSFKLEQKPKVNIYYTEVNVCTEKWTIHMWRLHIELPSNVLCLDLISTEKIARPPENFEEKEKKKIFTERKENEKKVFWNAETRINIDFIFISWLNLLRAQSLSSTSKTAMAWPIWLLFYRLTIRFFNYYQKSKFNLYAYQHENP